MIIAVILGLMIVALALYFLVFPEITFYYAAHENVNAVNIGIRLLQMGYRLRSQCLGADILDEAEALETKLRSCDSEAMLLSAGVSMFAQRTGFEKDSDGPVVMAVCMIDEQNRYDVIFQFSPLSGWDEASRWIISRDESAVVAITEETSGLADVFDDSRFCCVDTNDSSLRASSKVMTLYSSSNADYICCPYVSDFSSYLGNGGTALWILDSSLALSVPREFLVGTIEDDLFSSIRPLLKAGIRHSKTIELPLQRSFVKSSGSLFQ